MKSLLISLILLGVSPCFSQDYMQTILEKSCSCLGTIPDTLETQEFNMKLGICMIEAAMPYKKQLKKDYDINLDNMDTEGEKLGKVIGMKMITICPDMLVKITQKVKNNSGAAPTTRTSTGTITKIENDFFVTFSLKDDDGKISKYYWLTVIETEADLPNSYSDLQGKTVKITYTVQELFDPRIKEYRQFFVVKKISLTE